jgi:hypothetical protein
VKLPRFEDIVIDYSLLTDPFVKTFIAAEINGTFYNIKNPEPISEKPVVIPYRDMNRKAFQLFITEYTANTFLRSFYDSHYEFVVTDYMRKYLKLDITTYMIGKVIP